MPSEMTESKNNRYRLSVVLGTYNRLPLLKKCVDSIISETSVPTRIYITDAGSTDGTVEYLEGIASENIIPIFVGKKLGQAKAYNDVFSQITTPYACWLSDDNVVVNAGLDIAVQSLDKNPVIGMVGLKVKDLSGPFVSEAYIGGISEIGILNVNQGVLRTDVLKKLGGFSEEFRDYGIDPDLTARVLFEGHAVVYTKDIAINHYRDWGEGEVLNSQLAKQKNFQKLYREKYGGIFEYGKFWQLRRKLGSLVRKLGIKLAKMMNSGTLARYSRDWYNIMSARFISFFDHLKHIGKNYHLKQQVKPKTLSRSYRARK
jgi:glycosyltransferase involved in cell wall biosynthesis